MIIKTCKFLTSAKDVAQYPPDDRPEFAFAGRSNVGKSSLINSLLERKNLVKTSSKPGHTQMINFFDVNETFRFVDLPGYGYAAVSRSESKTWGPMIETYLQQREGLRALICLVDIRRGFEDDDMMLVTAAPHFGWQPIMVYTKADKLNRNQQWVERQKLAKKWGVSPKSLILYSSKTNQGRDELWKRIIQLGNLDAEPQS